MSEQAPGGMPPGFGVVDEDKHVHVCNKMSPCTINFHTLFILPGPSLIRTVSTASISTAESASLSSSPPTVINLITEESPNMDDSNLEVSLQSQSTTQAGQ